MTSKTHFCLVSGQAAPNLLPLLDSQMKPDNVVFLVTEPMKTRARWLENVVKPLGISVQSEPFTVSDDFADMTQQLQTIMDKSEGQELYLNVTGGTKLMAICAQELFRTYSHPVFYVDIDTDRVIFIDGEKAPIKLQERIKLENYIRTYGYSFKENTCSESGITKEQKDICEQLVGRVEEWSEAIGTLNRFASQAEKTNSLLCDIDPKSLSETGFLSLLKQFKGTQILSYDEASRKIKFFSEQTRMFCNGGWLELYVNSKLNTLKGKGLLQDKPHLNLEIQSGETKNELDIAFMAHNRLHIVECKTKNFTGKNARDVGSDALYKLDSLSGLGSIGKTMLVSYRELRAADINRAKALRIEVVHYVELRLLQERLDRWINSARNAS